MARRNVKHTPASRANFDRAVTDYTHNLLVGRSSASVLRTERDRLDEELLERLLDLGALEIPRHQVARWLPGYRAQHGAEPRAPAPFGPPYDENLQVLADVFRLDETELALARLGLALSVSVDLRDLVTSVRHLSPTVLHGMIADAAALPLPRVAEALSARARLRTVGLLTISKRSTTCSFDDLLELAPDVGEALGLPALTPADLRARLLHPAPPPELAPGDFAHLGDAVELASALVARASEHGARGVNVLLHGPTGTGKTDLTRVLAATIGAPLYLAGAMDEDGDSMTASARLGALQRTHALLEGSRALVLFDEMEDIFDWSSSPWESRRSNRFSKAWFNGLLESNPVPTFWCTNDIRGVDPAFLRRFSLVIEVPALGPRQRQRVLERHLGDRHSLDASDRQALTSRFRAGPAELASAVRTARLLCDDGPDRPTLERVLGPIEKAITGVDPRSRRGFLPGSYSANGVVASMDLEHLATQIGSLPRGAEAVSLCLYGPPGTGKTEYAHYLGYQLGRPVLERRVSDIQSMWVGQTEQRIAQSFAEAREHGAVLLFDEADSFLRDRTAAARSWEVTQVNEFLQQLERHEGIVVCTTNLWHAIDRAALRRFTFAVELGWLDAPRAATVFDRVLAPLLPAPMCDADRALVTDRLARLGHLAPGDFAVVARQARVTGSAGDPGSLLDALAAQVAAKREGGSRVGFSR